MLKKIYIDGFRNFKNFTLEPHFPHTLLCGLNGTGKTSIIEVLYRLQNFLVNNFSTSNVCSSNDIPRWEKKEFGSSLSVFEIDIEINDIQFKYKITIKQDFKNKINRVEKEVLVVNNEVLFSCDLGNATVISDNHKEFSFPVDWYFTGLALASRYSSKVKAFLEYVECNLFMLSINPAVNFVPAGFDSAKSFREGTLLEIDGKNVATWYGNLLDTNISAIAECFSAIKPFIKGFKQFSHLMVGIGGKQLYVDIQNKFTQKYQLEFNELSQGQKVLCILYLVLHTCPQNSVICIDEFENFLSPLELQPLYNLIQDVYEEKKVQCILVSHHQKTLNWLQDSAFILAYAENGPFIRMKDFSEETNISIDEYLFENQDA